MSGPPGDSESLHPLVLRFGALGDTVVLTAMLRDLTVRWGAPCDVVTGAGPQRRVLTGLDSVRQVLTLPSRRRPYLLAPSQWALVRWLRARRSAPTYLFDPLPKVGWLADRAGIPHDRRVSAVALPRHLDEHILDYQRRLGATLPAAWAEARRGGPPAPGHPAEPARPAEPELAVPDADRADCRRWIASEGWDGRPLVAVQSQSRRTNRGRWPAERWAAVVAGVLADLPEARVLLLGSPAEERAVEELRAACADPRAINVAAGLSLDRLFALVTELHSLISLDSGPAHVAAALDCPVVVLPGWADPRRNRPVGPPERVRVAAEAPPELWPPDVHGWERWHRLDAVPVEAVLEAWRGLSSRAARAPRVSSSGLVAGWRDSNRGP